MIGNGDSYLRAGPDNAPLGQGSLGIRTGAASDATSFGNQSDFKDLQIADITHLGFAVFTTDANNALAPNNMPSIKLEVDPNVTGTTTNYTTLVYAPDNGQANAWTTFDAVADPGAHWGFTGSFFNTPGTMNQRCGINGARCTFAQIQDYLAANNDSAQGPAKVTYSIAVGKGRDFAFSGPSTLCGSTTTCSTSSRSGSTPGRRSPSSADAQASVPFRDGGLSYPAARRPAESRAPRRTP